MGMFEMNTGDMRSDTQDIKRVGRVSFIPAETSSPDILNESPLAKETKNPLLPDEASLYLALSDNQNKQILDLSEHMFKIGNNVSVPVTSQIQQQLLHDVEETMETIAMKAYKNSNGACVKVDVRHVEREQILHESDLHALFVARIEDCKREDN